MDWSSFPPALLGALTAIAGLFLGDWLRRRSDRQEQSHRAAIAVRESTFALARLMNAARDDAWFEPRAYQADVSRLADEIRGHAIQVENETVREELIRNANLLDGTENLVGYDRHSPSSIAWPVKEWTDTIVKAYLHDDALPARPEAVAAADAALRELYTEWEDQRQAELEDRKEQARIRAARTAAERDGRPAEVDQND